MENIEIILVEIGFDVESARKLGHCLLLLDAGNPARFDNLFLELRFTGMVVVRLGLSDHHRKIRFPGDQGCVHIIVDEMETLRQELRHHVRIHQVELIPAIYLTVILIPAFGIVADLPSPGPLKNEFHIPVVSLHV